MSKVDDLIALLTKHDITVLADPNINWVLDAMCGRSSMRFAGTKHGELFVNLPITITTSHPDYSESLLPLSLCIIQRNRSNATFFVGGAVPFGSYSFLGDTLDDFTKLDVLLTKKTLRLYGADAELTASADNSNYWVEITLKK
jgi:hypothetical protein